jgi:AcrR family transcriptional regulator
LSCCVVASQAALDAESTLQEQLQGLDVRLRRRQGEDAAARLPRDALGHLHQMGAEPSPPLLGEHRDGVDRRDFAAQREHEEAEPLAVPGEDERFGLGALDQPSRVQAGVGIEDAKRGSTELFEKRVVAGAPATDLDGAVDQRVHARKSIAPGLRAGRALDGSALEVYTVNMETREEILRESREVLREKGIHGFSMRQVAERVGVSATALYRHFDDKDALLASLLEQGFTTFGGYLVRSLSGKTPLERLRLAGSAYFDFALEHPRDYALMFLTPCAELGFSSVSEQTKTRMDGTFVFLVDRVKECVAAGVVEAHAPEATALNIWAEVHGLASLRLNGQLADLHDAAFRERVEFMLDRIELSLRPGLTPTRA